ncbi:MAG: tagaturonate reductase [Rikenellaceae bacterium]
MSTQSLNRTTAQANSYTNRVIQFGKGNFLRGFAEWIISEMNTKLNTDMGVTIIQSVVGSQNDTLNEQGGLYHLVTKGIKDGVASRTVSLLDVVNECIDPYSNPDKFIALAEDLNNRFIISNTTEQGIAYSDSDKFDVVPAMSFPAKLTQLMYHRFEVCGGDASKGFIIIPCELIENNGSNLKECVMKYAELWALSAEFKAWVEEVNFFANTLVDRIVSGFPKSGVEELHEEIGYTDKLVVESEPYHLWVIQGDEIIAKEFTADKAGAQVLFVDDITPYRERKVTLLNAPHTALSPVGFLSGLDTVRECVEDEQVGEFVKRVMQDELLPTVSLPREELEQFANDVVDRFKNPYIRHMITGIMLNSFSKYKSRNLPPLKRYITTNGTLPKGLVMGLAAVIVYYKGGKRGEESIELKDDPRVIELLASLWSGERSTQEIAHAVLCDESIWGEDLTLIEGLEALTAAYMTSIMEQGMRATIAEYIA